MEVDCEMPVPEEDNCGTWWTQDNNDIVKIWKDSAVAGDAHVARQRVEQCYSDLSQLLMKIQGLPPTFPTLPLELGVLYNAIITHISVNGGFLDEHNRELEKALNRVLEALGLGETSNMAATILWEKVLAADYPLEMNLALNRLAGLQCACWLASNQLGDMEKLLASLNKAADPSTEADSRLLSLIKGWSVPREEPDSFLTVQRLCHIKDILYTSAAFLQGVVMMEASEFPRAVRLLQEAAGSLCSSRVLAEVYTCLGFCFYKMEKPQTALQYWKQALRVDFQCLAALYHSSSLYGSMGRTQSELEALTLLHKALENSRPDSSSGETLFLLSSELILRPPILRRFTCAPTPCEVKYLIACHCLRNKSVGEAVEHYLDLMTALQEDSGKEGLYPSPAPMPRMPVIYLEAASALLDQGRFQDAMAVCSEVSGSLGRVIPSTIHVVEAQADQEITDRLNCTLWASAAHLLQGEAQGMLGDHNASIVDYTRCINLLTKVQFVNPGSPDADGSENNVYGILKAAAFFGRGQQFQKLGRHNNALMNVKITLQVSPVFPQAASWLVNLLWTLGHKNEAASRWRKFQSDQERLHQQWDALSGDLPLYLSTFIQKGNPGDEPLVKELEEYLQNEDCSIHSDP